MICKEIPKAMYCHIGGSGTWGCEFPEDLNMEGVTLLQRDMEFETPFGVTACMKLYEMDASITADHKPRRVLYVPFHGWKGLSPYNDTPSERIFWALREAGVKYILADGSGGGINPLMEPGDIICPQDFIDYTKRVSYLGNSPIQHSYAGYRLPGPSQDSGGQGKQCIPPRIPHRYLRRSRSSQI